VVAAASAYAVVHENRPHVVVVDAVVADVVVHANNRHVAVAVFVGHFHWHLSLYQS